MNKMLFVVLSALFSVSWAAAQNPVGAERRELDSLLRAVRAADQEIREEVMRLYGRQPAATDSLLLAVVRQRQVDSVNQRFVFGVLDTDGWPDGLSGEANGGIWLVIQHASPEDV